MKNVEGKCDQQWNQIVNPKVREKETVKWESPFWTRKSQKRMFKFHIQVVYKQLSNNWTTTENTCKPKKIR